MDEIIINVLMWTIICVSAERIGFFMEAAWEINAYKVSQWWHNRKETT